MKKILILIFSLSACSQAFSESLIITNIDSKAVLFRQQVTVYGLLLDDFGNPLSDISGRAFSVQEHWDGAWSQPLEIVRFEPGVNRNENLYIVLLVDNSGSMYYNSDGSVRDSADAGTWRITAAVSAVTDFIELQTNGLHQLAVISFNSSVSVLSGFTDNRQQLLGSLQHIERPAAEQAYTELYEAMFQSGQLIREKFGRRIIIVLSDGENYEKDDNPEITVRHGAVDVLNLYQEEGITCFSIGLSSGADARSLSSFSEETGGLFTLEHDAANLRKLYTLINKQIENEFALTYKVPMKSVDETLLKLSYNDSEDQQAYFSGLLFGSSWNGFSYLLLLFVPAPFLLVFLTSGNRKGLTGTFLTVLSGKKKQISLNSGRKKRISIGDSSATIIEEGGSYTILTEQDDLQVNNKSVTQKTLTEGDLITIAGTTLLFQNSEKKDREEA